MPTTMPLSKSGTLVSAGGGCSVSQHLTVALWFSKRYPEPIQVFVFSDVTVALEGSSPPANPPPCTTMSPGRSCATLFPGCTPCSAADLMCTREVGTKSGYYGRGLGSSP